jgi:hypothetical protein
MTKRMRTISFAILAVLLVVAVNHLSTQPDLEHHQDQKSSNTAKPIPDASEQLAHKPKTNGRLIPLYAAGDLFVQKSPEVKKNKRPTKQKKPQRLARKKPTKNNPQHSKETAKTPPLAASPVLDGDRPVLDVAYEGIGFTRYLDVIERVGRLFLLIDNEGSPRLGPEISLKRGILHQRPSDMSLLATKRPHLVSDLKIGARLAAINIPDDALDDSVVLILTKPFDDLLWDTIADALDHHRLQLNQVSQITGAYAGSKGGVFLNFNSATVKGTGKRIRLRRKLRVSL